MEDTRQSRDLEAEWLELAADLCRAMRRKGLTARRLSVLSGFTPEYISMLLHGRRKSYSAIYRLNRTVSDYVSPV